MKHALIVLISFFYATISLAQNFDDFFNEQATQTSNLVTSTFKSVKLINAHTTKLPDKGDLVFLIEHRFGEIKSGFSDLWGLDNATIRLGFEYGASPTLALGFGRSTYRSSYDFFAKQILIRQSTGTKPVPITLGILAISNISSDKWPENGRNYLFAHRMSYTLQLLASRKFNRSLSVQIMPSYVHRNLVKTLADENDVFSVGAGGRMKLSNWVAFTAEYYLSLTGKNASDFENPLSLGFDIETGGHVFQLFFTNALAIYPEAVIAETTSKWSKGNVRFGFNISRTF